MTILEASVSIPDSTERCDSNPSAPPANGKAANRTSTAAECSGERPWASGRDGDHIRTLARMNQRGSARILLCKRVAGQMAPK